MTLRQMQIQDNIAVTIFILLMLIIYCSCGILTAFILGVPSYSLIWFATIIIWPLPLFVVLWFCLAIFGLTIATVFRDRVRILTKKEKE
jgi:hypothetical protein